MDMQTELPAGMNDFKIKWIQRAILTNSGFADKIFFQKL